MSSTVYRLPVFAILLSACGGGDNSINSENPPVTTAVPGGGIVREIPPAVILQTDEPAVIYYTTDGSIPTTSSTSGDTVAAIFDLADGDEIQFFAVDLDGNAEEIQTATYTLDVDGPAPVTELSADLTGANVSVTWTAPAGDDVAGVLIARGPVSVDPVDGNMYAAGDTLEGDEEILYVGSDETISDALGNLSHAEYAVWAFDELGNYSPMRVSNLVFVPLADQIATISVSHSGTVTVSSSAANLGLSGTASYDNLDSELTVSLEVTNNAGRVLHNLKALVEPGTDPGPGIVAGRLFDGKGFAYYGPEALGTSEARSRDIVIGGIAPEDDPAVFKLTFVDHPTLVAQSNVIDSSGAIANTTSINVSDGRSSVFDSTGRFWMSANKTDPVIQVVDMTTLESVADILLGPWGSIAGLSVVGGRVYAAYNNGAHYNCSRGNESGNLSRGGVEIVSIDLQTFAEVERFPLIQSGGDGVCARGMALSPDNALAAVTVGRRGEDTNEVWIVDLGAMAVTDGTQPIVLSETAGFVRHPTWSDTGERIYVGFDNLHKPGGGDSSTPPPLDVVDVATGVVTTLSVTSAARISRGYVEREGKLYFNSADSNNPGAPGVVVHTLDGGAETTPDPGWPTGFGGSGVLFNAAGDRYYVSGHRRQNCETAVFATVDNTRVDDDGNGDLNLSLCSTGHGDFALSPF